MTVTQIICKVAVPAFMVAALFVYIWTEGAWWVM